MAQWVWGCSLAHPLPSPPSTGWGQLRGHRAPHCLQVLGPQAPSRVGRAEQTPSAEWVTCFTVSLSASMGFIGYWAPVAPRVTLLRKSGPQDRVRLPPGSGWAEGWLFARREGGCGGGGGPWCSPHGQSPCYGPPWGLSEGIPGGVSGAHPGVSWDRRQAAGKHQEELPTESGG